MAATRTQLTTYLSTDDQHDDWRVIREQYGDTMGDAVLIRHLFKEIADNIRAGRAGPPSADRFDAEMAEVKRRLAEVERMLKSK